MHFHLKMHIYAMYPMLPRSVVDTIMYPMLPYSVVDIIIMFSFVPQTTSSSATTATVPCHQDHDDDDGHDDHNHDRDIYIMMECICVCNEKVTSSWIVGDYDIYMPKLHSASPHLHLPGLPTRQRHQFKSLLLS